jgi:hypothetical protein
MSSKSSSIQLYSQKILENYPSIKDSRKIINISDIFQNVTSYEDIKDEFNKVTLFKKEFSFLRLMSTSYCPHYHTSGYVMKWHIDDAQVINHRKNNDYNEQIKISEKKSLYYPNKKPKYSLIIYGSTYNEDFTGGILEFSDGTKIKPQKDMCILFNSNEAHCVHKIKSGVRMSLLIKFYEN